MAYNKILNFLPLLLVCSIFLRCSGPDSTREDIGEIETTSDSLNDGKGSGEWEVLFDGRDLSQWRSVKSEEFPSDAWIIEDGSLVLAQKGGDIVTREKYDEFELVWEFKLTEGANSGIKYFVDTLAHQTSGEKVINGPEFQIIDDYNHPEIKEDPQGLSSTASLYLLYAPENKNLKPAGEWNEGKILSNGRQVEHWLNGTKVLSYERGSKEFLEKMSETKFKDYPGYGQANLGHILLTDHGDKVYFRNIRIKRR
jgi:hypothetical protein